MRVTDPWWVWLLPVLFAAPWITVIIWFWSQEPRDGAVSPSMADRLRERLAKF
jgi:hypothetical protein